VLYVALREEPRWIDLRWAQQVEQVDRRNPRFLECLADLAATLRGLQKDSLIGEDVRQHRRTLRLAGAAIAVLSVLTLVVSTLAVVAYGQWRVAIAGRMLTEADIVRDRDPRAALQLGAAAYKLDPTPQGRGNLLETLTTPYLSTLDGHGGPVNAVAFSPSADMNLLATGSGDRSVMLWDATDRGRPRRLSQTLDGDETVESIGFGPDGRTLAVAYADGKVRLWDVSSPDRPRPLELVEERGTRVARSAVGESRAISLLVRGELVRLNLGEPGRPRVLRRQLAGVDALSFTAISADRLATFNFTLGEITVWDLGSGKPRRITHFRSEQQKGITAMAFGPNGGTLVTGGSDGTVAAWRVTDRQSPKLDKPLQRPHSRPVLSVALSPDGRTLASGSADNTVALVDLAGKGAPRRLRGNDNAISNLAFNRDGTTLVSASIDKSAILWDVTARAGSLPYGQPFVGHTDRVLSVAISGDGRSLVTGGEDRRAILWDLGGQSGRPVMLASVTAESPISSVAITNDARIIAVGTVETRAVGEVALWDVSDPRAPRSLGRLPPLSHLGTIYTLTFTPDGRSLIVGGSAFGIILWDVTDPTRPLRFDADELKEGSETGFSSALSPDGRILVTSNIATGLTFWNLQDRAHPKRLHEQPSGHGTTAIDAMTLTKNGILTTGARNGTIIIWNASDPQNPRELARLEGNDGYIFSVAISVDEQTLAAGGRDGALRLWDISEPSRPRPLGSPLAGHDGQIASIALTSSGRTLISGGQQPATMEWDLAALTDLRQHAAEVACARAGKPLSPEDWALYAGRLPYRDSCAT
jgi:WD40 repeat protein